MGAMQKVLDRLARLYRLREEGHDVDILIRECERLLWTKGLVDREVDAKKSLEVRSKKRKET